MYLLDTNVVSEFRRNRPHGGVLAWLKDQPDEELHIAAITIGEIQAGIEITREQDPGRAAEISKWLDAVAAGYTIIPMDARIFRSWARLMHHRSSDLMGDAMIAATAEVHRLTIVTRNTADFSQLGCKTIDPFKTPHSPG